MSIAIFDDGLECFLLVFIKYQSVGDVEGVIDKEEGGQIEPHQLINRASPSVNEKKILNQSIMNVDGNYHAFD